MALEPKKMRIFATSKRQWFYRLPGPAKALVGGKSGQQRAAILPNGKEHKMQILCYR